MPKVFHRVISFEVEGELYDSETSPEEIIKGYQWHFKDYDDNHGENKCFVEAHHRDHRGRITKLTKLQKITKTKVPDSEYFII